MAVLDGADRQIGDHGYGSQTNSPGDEASVMPRRR